MRLNDVNLGELGVWLEDLKSYSLGGVCLENFRAPLFIQKEFL